MICGGKTMALPLLVLYSEMRNYHHGLDAKTLQYICVTHTECVIQVLLSNGFCRRYYIGYFVYHSENPFISIVSHDQTNGQSMNTHSNPGSGFVKALNDSIASVSISISAAFSALVQSRLRASKPEVLAGNNSASTRMDRISMDSQETLGLADLK